MLKMNMRAAIAATGVSQERLVSGGWRLVSIGGGLIFDRNLRMFSWKDTSIGFGSPDFTKSRRIFVVMFSQEFDKVSYGYFILIFGSIMMTDKCFPLAVDCLLIF